MRRLFILRHSKAVPLSQADDYDRELTERGQADAARIGAWMAGQSLAPDYAIYSGSARTKGTYEIVAAALPRPFEAVVENALYEATWQLIMELLRGLPLDARAALVVGHNPGMADIASVLAGEGPEAERMRMASKFPAGALAVLSFDTPDWTRLAPLSGRLESFVAPSQL
jgi:phosphohistidine phosphatase